MTNNNRERATKVALNETDATGDGGKKASGDNAVNRNFGITDLWSIRRNTRTIRIHNRIPRL